MNSKLTRVPKSMLKEKEKMDDSHHLISKCTMKLQRSRQCSTCKMSTQIRINWMESRNKLQWAQATWLTETFYISTVEVVALLYSFAKFIELYLKGLILPLINFISVNIYFLKDTAVILRILGSYWHSPHRVRNNMKLA